MRLKWNMNNVVATRGNTYTCIARFDNSRFWLKVNAITSVQNFKGDIRRIAQLVGAKEVEIKYLHMDDEAGTLTATGDPASGTISIKIENGSVIGSDNVEHTLTLSYSGPITKWQYLPPLKGEKVKR